MNNKCSILLILVLTFTILIFLIPVMKTRESFTPNFYNWRDLYLRSKLPLFRYLENRDRRILDDPLVAPERRVQNYQYPFPLMGNNFINYPTRGFPENYQQLGLATRTNDEKIFQLFGRPTFPGSNQWEYYVKTEKEGYINKIPIISKHQRELEDEDEIEILGMDPNKGKFKIKLFNYDAPRYNPYF